MSNEAPTAAAPAPSGPSQRQLWEPHFSENQIIEYSCGNCGKIVYWNLWRATYCPHCGAPIFNFPRRKLDGQYRGWAYRDQEAVEYVGPHKGVRKASPGGRPAPPAKGRRHAHAFPQP